MTVVPRSGRGAIAAATPAWMELLKKAGQPSPFSTPAWAATWLSVYGDRHRPLILEVRSGDSPVALLPMQMTRYPGVRTRRIEFISGAAPTPRAWVFNPRHTGQAYWNDLLVMPGCEREALTALHDWLQLHRDMWDELRLACVPATSPLATDFDRLKAGWSSRVEVQTKVAIDTSAGWTAYRARLSKRQQRHLRYEPNALARASGAELTLQVERGERVPRLMDDFLDLFERRWSSRGRVIMPRENHRFYQRLAATNELNPAFYVLRAGERPLAMQFGFDDGRRYVPYAFAFDASMERVSPANVLIHYAIKRCCEDGHAEVDLAALDQFDRWAGEPRQRVHLVARSPRLPARLRSAGLELVSRGLVSADGSKLGQLLHRTTERTRRALSGGLS